MVEEPLFHLSGSWGTLWQFRRSPGRDGTWPSDPLKMAVAELSEHARRRRCDVLE